MPTRVLNVDDALSRAGLSAKLRRMRVNGSAAKTGKPVPRLATMPRASVGPPRDSDFAGDVTGRQQRRRVGGSRAWGTEMCYCLLETGGDADGQDFA